MLFDNPNGCPFCGADVIFDLNLDINVCYNCGAHETAKGWMNPSGGTPHQKQNSPEKNSKADNKPETKCFVPNRADKIVLFRKKAQEAKQAYAALSTCPLEQRSELQRRILQYDAELWELYHEIIARNPLEE